MNLFRLGATVINMDNIARMTITSQHQEAPDPPAGEDKLVVDIVFVGGEKVSVVDSKDAFPATALVQWIDSHEVRVLASTKAEYEARTAATGFEPDPLAVQ